MLISPRSRLRRILSGCHSQWIHIAVDAASVSSTDRIAATSIRGRMPGTASMFGRISADPDRADSAKLKIFRADHFDIFDSLPGAGDALVPRLIPALGSRRQRLHSAYEIEVLTGIAPVVRQGGNMRSTHCRQAYPHFLRQMFHEWATHSITKSEWA